MSRETVLAQGRARVEASMSETIAAGVFAESVNDAHETVLTLVGDEIYAGPASVEYPTLTVSDTESPGQVIAVTDITVKIPVAAAVLPKGTTILIGASISDPTLVGKKFRTKGPAQSGQVTTHRYPVTEES